MKTKEERAKKVLARWEIKHIDFKDVKLGDPPCNKCSDGHIFYSGFCQPMSSPNYQYMCDSCDYEKYLNFD